MVGLLAEFTGLLLIVLVYSLAMNVAVERLALRWEPTLPAASYSARPRFLAFENENIRRCGPSAPGRFYQGKA